MLGVLRRSWRFVVLLTVLGAVVGAAAGVATRAAEADEGPTRTYYAATQTVGVDASGLPQVAIGQFASLDGIGVYTTSDAVIARVVDKLGGDPADLAQRVTTVVQPAANAVDITVVAETPEDAEATAEAFAAALIDEYQRQTETQSANQAEQVAKRLEDLKARREQVEQQLAVPGLSVVERDTLDAQRDALVNQYRITYDRFISLGTADTAASPLYTLSAPVADSIDADAYQGALARGRAGQNHLNAEEDAEAVIASSSGKAPTGPVPLGILGAVLGFAVAAGIVLVRDRFDARLRTPEDFELAYGLPVLCGIPDLDRKEMGKYPLVVSERPFSAAAEAYRALRSSVLMVAEDCAERRGALVVLVTSPHPSEGKSTTSANLAVALAESGRSVLVVNADYQHPTLHRFFRLDDHPGELMAPPVAGALRVVSNVVSESRLPGQIATDQIRFVEHQRDQFDVILLDAAPVLSSSNPLDLMAATDLVLLVGRVGATRSDLARQTVEVLKRHKAHLAGVAMIGIAEMLDGYYYSYGGAPMAVSTSGTDAPQVAASDGLTEPVAPAAIPEPVARAPVPAPRAPADSGAGWTSGSVAIRWVDVDDPVTRN